VGGISRCRHGRTSTPLPLLLICRLSGHGDTTARPTPTGRLSGDINTIFGKGIRGIPMEDFFADWQYDLIYDRQKRVVVEPGQSALLAKSGPSTCLGEVRHVSARVVRTAR
jgi:hypothetical protein